VPLWPVASRPGRVTDAEGLAAGESLLSNDCDRVAETELAPFAAPGTDETRGRGLTCPPDRGDDDCEEDSDDDDPLAPVESARATGTHATTEPTPSATANAPTRPTYSAHFREPDSDANEGRLNSTPGSRPVVGRRWRPTGWDVCAPMASPRSSHGPPKDLIRNMPLAMPKSKRISDPIRSNLERWVPAEVRTELIAPAGPPRDDSERLGDAGAASLSMPYGLQLTIH
jgi:hypothetical protein